MNTSSNAPKKLSRQELETEVTRSRELEGRAEAFKGFVGTVYTLRFTFDEESLNKTEAGCPSATGYTSQSRYSPDYTHFVLIDRERVPIKRSSFSFCKEPDQFFSTICVREEGIKNQSGSHSSRSESTSRWVE